MEPPAESALSRVQEGGHASASALDLLTLAISRTPKDLRGNEAAAQKLLNRFRLPQLHQLGRADLKEAAGLEAFESERMLAALALGRRCAMAGQGTSPKVSGDEDAVEYFRYLADAAEERFALLMLDAAGGVIGQRTLHIGTLMSTVVGVREVFREAVRSSAASIIVAHNHPSGSLEPSPADIAVTAKLREAGELLDIAVLDHLIIGAGGHFSMSREGYL